MREDRRAPRADDVALAGEQPRLLVVDDEERRTRGSSRSSAGAVVAIQ